MRSGLRSPCAAPVRLSTSSSISRCAAKPTISRSKSASELFSSSVRRLIISSVIVGSSVSVEGLATKPYRRSAMTTAMDKWPAAARLVAVAAAGHLPTAPTPPQGSRPLSCLRLNAVDGLDELGTSRGGGILQYHNPYAVAFAPEDIGAIPDVLLYRRDQNALKSLLGNLVLRHALLRVAANGHVAEFRDVAVEVGHLARLPKTCPHSQQL